MNDEGQEFEAGQAAMAASTEVITKQIRKLAELHQDGILSDEEFTTKKTELLSRL